MAETPQAGVAPAKNAFLKIIRQPRVMLILLGAWNIVGAVSELLVDVDGKIRGPTGGLALSWESIPLAVLYLYCARDPERYQRVFWLALVQQAAAIVANIAHRAADDMTTGAIIAPVAVAAGLGVLVFLHLFQPKPAPTGLPTSGTAGGATS